MRFSISVAGLLLLLASFGTNAQQSSLSKGAFTAEQAKNGEAIYQTECASCHGTDLRSTDPEAPDLTEGIFKFGWKGKTVDEVFGQVRNTMPLGNPRSLSDQAYVDILTFIFMFNGAPTGNQKLEAGSPAMKQIVIEAPN